MSYGRYPYGGVGYAGADVAEIPQDDTDTILSVEVAFTTGALEEPVWVDVTADVRAWDTTRGRGRELERFQPGRATIVLANRERQYDSHHATGPYFGNLRPMRRVRIRETFNGVTYPVFDGSVDGWHLNYPGMGLDATATIIATDAFKIFGRTDLPRSVYDDVVAADTPEFWWRLDEGLEEGGVALRALNNGSTGEAGTGTYVGAPRLGSDRLVANDPGTSIELTNNTIAPGTPVSGVDIPSSQINALQRLQDGLPLTIEFWARPHEDTSFGTAFYQEASTPAISGIQLYWFTGGVNLGRFAISAHTDTVTAPVSSSPPGSINHLVYRFTPSGADQICDIFLNGTLVATGTLNDTLNTGTIITSGIGHTISASSNWVGNLSQFAIYLDALDSDRILVHYEAGTHPWQDDQPADRAGRVLDEIGWPAGWRNLDTGNVALQSAAFGHTALEHLQKVGETEFGLLFMGRDGNVRLVGREAMFGREPDPAVFGDGVGEVGYRAVTFDDGDTTVRNRATISRLNGVAKVSVDAASVTEFGRFDYALEGLLHRSDSYSLDYANLVTGEYAEPRRRVTSLALGPPAADADATLLPQMLGREIGDAVVVKDTPLGGGDRFEQTCVIEGVTHQWDPHAGRTASWVLSPEFAVRALEEEDVATLGYARVVVAQSGITSTEVDLTGLTVDVVVGANRYIKITANCPHFRSAADGLTRYSIHEGAAKLQFADVFQRAVEGGSLLCNFSVVLQAPSAGAHTYKLRGDIVTGTGTAQLNATTESPAFILVEDIGPV